MTQIQSERAPEMLRAEPVVLDRPRATPSAGLLARIDGGLAACLAAAWMVAYCSAAMVEPAPNDPAVMHAWYATVINSVLLGSLFVMVLGLIARRRIGVAASAVATVAFAAAVIACPVTGHHAPGIWWIGQLACVALVAVATGVTLHRTRS